MVKVLDKTGREVKVEYRCLGGKVAQVDIRCCFESDTIWNYVQDGYTDEMQTRLPKHILELLSDFCVKRWETFNTTRYDNDDPRHVALTLQDFDWEFVSKQPMSVLVQLAQAACKLRVENLLNVVHDAIVDRLGHDVDKLFDMWGFPHKAFEERKERLKLCSAWGYKQIIP